MLVELAQGLIGFVQYFTDLPVILVGVHMLGACLVWIATLGVIWSTRERVAPGPDAPHRRSGGAAQAASILDRLPAKSGKSRT